MLILIVYEKRLHLIQDFLMYVIHYFGFVIFSAQSHPL